MSNKSQKLKNLLVLFFKAEFDTEMKYISTLIQINGQHNRNYYNDNCNIKN